MKRYTLYFAWILSLIGILWSVYNGEILGAEPCRLCWYQRCSLFPLGILLGAAVYRNDENFSFYGLILAGSGAILALIQIFMPTYLCSSGCTENSPVFWFLSLPMIGVIGFSAIFALLLIHKLPRDFSS